MASCLRNRWMVYFQAVSFILFFFAADGLSFVTKRYGQGKLLIAPAAPWSTQEETDMGGFLQISPARPEPKPSR